MSASFARHRFHTFFYCCIYLLYVAALFFAADISDLGFNFHTIVRLVLAAFELAVACAAGLWLLDRWLRMRAIGWWALYVLLAAVMCLVYAAQVYSIWLSNNFISVLAIQNARYSLFTMSSSAVVMVAASLVWIAVLGIYAWRGTFSRVRSEREENTNRPGCKWVAGITVGALALFIGLLLQQRSYVSLEPSFLQTPVASLLANTWVAAAGAPVAATKPMADTSMCFKDPGADTIAGYPFQKNMVYRNPLPFAKTPGAPVHPNVIIFFTEGASARMIGAYGAKYPGLTPNIDRLAGHSMRVIDYFNHTAATYRALTGQTTSGFTFANGNDWKQGDNATLLTTVKRQSLAAILNEKDYDTYFFEPEHPGAFEELLRSLGFAHIYGFDRISALLGGKVHVQKQTDQIEDSNLFEGLTAFLKQRSSSGDKKPFFIGLYNIGTHAFIPVATDGVKYGNGESKPLNKLHNYDADVGQFMDWFYQSPYAGNTIVIFTTDHATYPDKPYRAVVGADLKPYFVDKIPLLIMDPTHALPKTLNADGRNSLDLAPTVLHLLGIQRLPNSFLGQSLFEPRSFAVGIAALGSDFYITTRNAVYTLATAPASLQTTADCERDVVRSYYTLEQQNRIFLPPAGWSMGRSRKPVETTHLCSLDAINGVQIGEHVELPIGKTATFGGWFATKTKRPITSFSMQLSGETKFWFAAHDTVSRPDVAKAIDSGAADNAYGFNTSTDFRDFRPGTYYLSLVDPSGLTCSTGKTLTLYAKRASAP